jgi:hypothetical protein
MTYRPDLSAAQHVARREALTQIGRGGELHDGYHRLMDMLTPTFQEFMLRNRLDGAGFEALVQRIRSLITGFGPSSFREFRRPPTRTRPKAEEHEFLTVIRSSDEEESGRGGYELAGLRILLTRRRIMFSFERNGMFVTRHALERSIERGLASWTGRLAEVEDAMLENLGLALAWRRAFETGVTPSGEMVLPCRGGLILGTMERVEQPRECPSFAVGRSKAKHALAPSPLVVHAPLNDASARTDTVLCTVIDEDLMRLEQVDLRDALGRFCSANEGLLSDIATSALWRTAANIETRDADALVPGLDALATELAGLLSREGASEAIGADRVRQARPSPERPPAPIPPAQAVMPRHRHVSGRVLAAINANRSSARFRRVGRRG